MKNVNGLLGLFAATALLLLTNEVNAQESKAQPDYLNHWRVGFGLNGGLSTNNAYDFALGADARLQYDLTTKTSLSATTGYTHLFIKNTDDAGFVPAKLGFKSFLGDQIYVLGEVGAAIGTQNGMGTSFLWAPGIGIATKHVDISLRYEDYHKFDTNQIALRLAYGFRL